MADVENAKRRPSIPAGGDGPPIEVEEGDGWAPSSDLDRLVWHRGFTPDAILLSLVMGSVYGSMLWGVLPLWTGVFWEGYLFGFIGGGLAAYLLGRRSPPGV